MAEPPRGVNISAANREASWGPRQIPPTRIPSHRSALDPALDESRLAWIIRIVTWLILGMAVESMALAALTTAPRRMWCRRCVFVAAAAWMSWARARLGTRGAAWFASRVAIVMLVTLVGLVLLVPSTAASLTVAPFLPFLLALPYLRTISLRRLAVGTWIVSLGVAVVAAATALNTPPGGARRGCRHGPRGHPRWQPPWCCICCGDTGTGCWLRAATCPG